MLQDDQPIRWKPVWLVLAAALVIYHIGLIFWGLVPNLVSRPLHMAFVLPWIFVFSERGKAQLATGAVFAVLGMAASIWIAWNHDALGDQYGFLENGFQIAVAVTLLVCVLEAARRAIGWPLPVVAALALAYALLGQLVLS